MKHRLLITIIALLCVSSALAKVDLVTLPTRDTVQVTIYNSADLTLVRESRSLTLKEGINRLQFSWANTLIDPTSLEMLAKAHADRIHIFDLVFPPRTTNLGLWNIRSEVSARAPVEITYLTSGLSWRAFYMGTLSPDETTMRLQGYVRVTNNSGEDYENAQTRLIVGKIDLLDEIARLARSKHPYGRPGEPELPSDGARRDDNRVEEAEVRKAAALLGSRLRRREIRKEGLSEYFLYTIEGADTIPHGWSKRLPSFDVAEVPAVNLYRFEEERYGPGVVRFLSFRNDEEHKLGETPIPGGGLKVYRLADAAGHLSYEGQSNFKYIPVNEDVELLLGPVGNIVAEPALMDVQTANHRFDGNLNVSGYDEIRTYRIKVKNTRALPVKVEIRRNFPTSYWSLDQTDRVAEFEKVDKDTVKFTLDLEPASEQMIQYVLTTYHGKREEESTQ